MDVHLAGDLERRVQEKMQSGRYGSADEVLREALQALEERDQELEARATAFQVAIVERLASGPATPMDFAALKRRLRDEAEERRNVEP